MPDHEPKAPAAPGVLPAGDAPEPAGGESDTLLSAPEPAGGESDTLLSAPEPAQRWETELEDRVLELERRVLALEARLLCPEARPRDRELPSRIPSGLGWVAFLVVLVVLWLGLVWVRSQ